ncbi:DUF2922 domain-containing protein [Clostridium gasigenes]|uniref:DUF2922 domain-containing protein n=1 Tax=Clostridium gasigenes TaxID=94869 RepID=UPI001624ED67|nr:DUF2922 domain-containing protein [Clostridium gasigenes]MBB6625282.1 DUF2922 domain-containing protein [Clostridium gasigenes]MBU3089888.1 DUF2922 domain-containing protein [Clostridium gasigenes]
MVERLLSMKFNDADEGEFTFAIKDIKAELKDSDIKVAMESIVAKDIFLSKGGKLKSIEEAQIVTKETTDVVL